MVAARKLLDAGDVEVGLLLVKSRRLPEDGLEGERADENEAGACFGSTIVGTCCYRTRRSVMLF